MLVMALDVEKAFNHLEMGYLLQLLKSMNFRPNFLRMIRAMYNEPQAQEMVNNLRSEDLKLSRGTCQGCPLSPILFAPSLEPLAEAIQSLSSIAGVVIENSRHVISLFADDTMVYITDPIELKHLMPLIGGVGAVSGFAINWTKTELYPVKLPPDTQLAIQVQYNFKCITTAWRHLGVLIPLDLSNLYTVNYIPLINKIRGGVAQLVL